MKCVIGQMTWMKVGKRGSGTPPPMSQDSHGHSHQSSLYNDEVPEKRFEGLRHMLGGYHASYG